LHGSTPATVRGFAIFGAAPLDDEAEDDDVLIGAAAVNPGCGTAAPLIE
jgi:hypothetical protein